MKYSSILKGIEPVESGDFMKQYEVNGRDYVIYSPEKDKCSCLELYTFTNITPEQLAFFISAKETDEEEDEFRFTRICPQNDLVKYLFDIEDFYEGIGICHVSKSEGYVMYDIENPGKIRNFYICDNNGPCRLKFKNENCFAASGDENSREIALCWSPVDYKINCMNAGNRRILLLPGSNPVVCACVCEMIKHNDCDKVCLFPGGVTGNAFQFLSYYLKSMRHEYAFDFSFSSFSNTITLTFENWAGDRIMNVVSSVNKACKALGFEITWQNYDDRNLISYNKNDEISKVLMTEILKRLDTGGLSIVI